MPVQIGPVKSSVDIVDILLACHDRIRRFSDAAVRLAAQGTSATEVGEAEVGEAAARIRYYFRASFPSHLEDEDDTVLPRLHGLGADVDDALATMERDHEDHAPALTRLLELCDALVEDPCQHAAVATELGEVAATLRDQFARHLAMEEATILPAIRERLSHDVQAEMLYEARARRGDG